MTNKLPGVDRTSTPGQEATGLAVSGEGNVSPVAAHRFVPDADPYCRLCGLPNANRAHDYTPRHRAAS